MSNKHSFPHLLNKTIIIIELPPHLRPENPLINERHKQYILKRTKRKRTTDLQDILYERDQLNF